MSGGPTLNSRLRVLVAKAFRAEKLYSSIRNSQNSRPPSPNLLAEMANDIRSKEWQRSHYQLRTALNEILALGINSEIAQEVAKLKIVFGKKAKESDLALEKGTSGLLEPLKRQEFAHIFKVSLELVRHKARAQANKVIVDELSALLDASGRGELASEFSSAEAVNAEAVNTVEYRENFTQALDSVGANVSNATSVVGTSVLKVKKIAERAQVQELATNVIPLRRKAAGGNRFR